MTHHCKGRQRGSQGLRALSRPGRAHHPPCSVAPSQAWQLCTPRPARRLVQDRCTSNGDRLPAWPPLLPLPALKRRPPGWLPHPSLKSTGHTMEEEEETHRLTLSASCIHARTLSGCLEPSSLPRTSFPSQLPGPFSEKGRRPQPECWLLPALPSPPARLPAQPGPRGRWKRLPLSLSSHSRPQVQATSPSRLRGHPPR